MSRTLAGVAVAWLVFAALVAPAHAQSSAIEGKRLALVIGNGAYDNGPLRNPGNDARAMARTLRALGFEVIEHHDLDFQGMRRAVVEFGEKMAEGGVSLFYYSGHGLQVGGRNYLIPLRARLTSERYVAAETVELDAVLKEMDAGRSALNIVILDACRDNPLTKGWRSSSRGLAPTNAPPGTVVAYATDPGDVASDGEPGANGVFTGELLKLLPQPGLKIEEVFKRAYNAVYRVTNGRQQPWLATKFNGDFYFATRPAPVATPGPTAPRPAALTFEDRLEQALLKAQAPDVKWRLSAAGSPAERRKVANELLDAGTQRLSDDDLINMLALFGIAISRLPVPVCAANLSGKSSLSEDEILALLDQHGADLLLDIAARAAIAEHRGAPPPRKPPPGNVHARLMDKVSAEDAARVKRALDNRQTASDDELCWAFRTMINTTVRLSRDDQAAVAREIFGNVRR